MKNPLTHSALVSLAALLGLARCANPQTVPPTPVAHAAQPPSHLQLCPERHHLIGDALIGTWVAADEVNRAMGASDEHMHKLREVEFSESESWLKELPYLPTCTYRAGYMRLRGSTGDKYAPFALVNVQGHPRILFYERDKEGRWDLESFHVALVHARGKDSHEARLFVGDDQASEGFVAFERK